MNTFTELQEAYPLSQIGITIAILLGYLILKRILAKIVSRRALLHNFDATRADYIKKAVNVGFSAIFLGLIGIVWEVSLQGLSVYITSIVAILGVALFANWSIASNITASVVLFFFFPFKVGSKVKIVDGDNSAEGMVMGVSLFSIRIQREDGQDIYYPNNLAVQKSIIHLKD